MSHPPHRPARSRLHVSVVATAVLVAILLPLTVHLARRWHALSDRRARLETELATLSSRNVVLQRASDALSLSKFQLCNKSRDALSLPWLAAVYHDGRRLQLFDPLRCQGFRPPELGGGESRVLNHSSTEEGCNWNGSVAFYALHLERESEAGSHAYNVAGAWRGFDRDCFTVE
jgi:hypothetical protein